MRRSHLLPAFACVAALAACGGGDDEEGAPIPQGSVGELERQLTSVENRIEFARDASPAEAAGACDDIEEDNIPSVDRLLARVPEDVEADVRDALQRSFDRLFELARSECDELAQKEDTTEETTPTETTPAPTIPETTPTETQPTETLEQGESGKPKKPKKQKDQSGGQQGPNQGEDGGAVAPED